MCMVHIYFLSLEVVNNKLTNKTKHETKKNKEFYIYLNQNIAVIESLIFNSLYMLSGLTLKHIPTDSPLFNRVKPDVCELEK